MNIGYDGKRAFQNKTGLGNYIRSLIAILTHHYPQHDYTLFAPKITGLFDVTAFQNVKVIAPQTSLGKRFPGLWRRKGMLKEIVNNKTDIFHGVSNEIPNGIEHTTVKTVVTVHDLIYERYPETYTLDVRYVSRWKIKHACKHANAVIAISQQTKNDLMHFYGVDENKISICYQSCNPIFQRVVGEAEKNAIKKRYNLPDTYFLFVSSITGRKNLIAVCKALVLLKDATTVPLVIIGNGKKEKEEAKKFMSTNGISDRLIFLNELPQSKESNFTTAADFPAIYQQALALVYPSIFEGFGAPLLEALCSGLPVISSNTSSLPEVGGDAALYFSPHDHATLAAHMLQISTDSELVTAMRKKGFAQAQKFTTQKHADSIMQVYQKIL
ncbi:MAG TPA: glycosyltransferase family 1 protein [Ferruginibacter sp.]|jgi:glycosyltransferase involved in cell wall biosynthesis|nr:glycosyltransferase family 1 protein [Ferruginibacter sp.]